MNLKVLALLLVIIVAAIPAYYLVKYVEKKVKPRESAGGLVIYLILASFIVFIFVLGIGLLLMLLLFIFGTQHFGGAIG